MIRRWRARRHEAEIDDISWRLNEAMTLYANGDAKTAEALVDALCRTSRQAFAVAFALAAMIGDEFRQATRMPPGASIGACARPWFPGGQVPDSELAGAELAAAIIAGVGNGDSDGVLTAWLHEPAQVCLRATGHLFRMATAMAARPADGGGS